MLVAAIALLAPARARAAYPGGNGMLSFVNRLGGWSKDYSLLRVNADGTGLGELFPPNPTFSINVDPAWSPGGTRRPQRRAGSGVIYGANADGTGEKALTPGDVSSGFATWSPDGTKIAYRRYSTANAADASLWEMSGDGSGQHEVIEDTVGEGKCSAWLSEMDWGIDDRIVFTAACTSGATQGWRLWTAKGNGTVSPAGRGRARHAGDQPERDRLVARRQEDRLQQLGHAVPRPEPERRLRADDQCDGPLRRRLRRRHLREATPTSLRDGPHETDPAWSPDGARIAFVASTLACTGTVFDFKPSKLFTMAAGGGDVKQITNPQPGTGDGPYGAYTIDTNDQNVDWQPCVTGVTANCTSVAKPHNSAPPAIDGDTATVGKPVTCKPGEWNGQSSLGYGWALNDAPIGGAAGSTYTPVTADAGGQLSCTVTGTGAGGSESVSSPPVTVQPGSGSPAPPATKGAVKASSVIHLPGTRACVSRRALRITLLHAPKGERLLKATVRIGARKPHTTTRHLTAPVVLRGLPRGRWTVKVTVTTTKRTLSLTRRYRTCAPKRHR